MIANTVDTDMKERIDEKMAASPSRVFQALRSPKSDDGICQFFIEKLNNLGEKVGILNQFESFFSNIMKQGIQFDIKSQSSDIKKSVDQTVDAILNWSANQNNGNEGGSVNKNIQFAGYSKCDKEAAIEQPIVFAVIRWILNFLVDPSSNVSFVSKEQYIAPMTENNQVILRERRIDFVIHRMR